MAPCLAQAAPVAAGKTVTVQKPAVVAEPIPSDAEAEAAFAAAQKAYQNVQQTPQPKAAPTVKVDDGSPQVVVFSDPMQQIVPGTDRPKNVSLENIRVVVDVENDSLREIMYKVIAQAAKHTGPWQVKWRLKPENMGVMDERVNLTAEAKFSDFVDLLTDRVKNMTGVQLFITTFNESRIIMVADTYY